jgi:hypothetical protein
MIEYWESKADDGLILNLIPAIHIKKDPIPLNADLLYSNIPVFHHSGHPYSGIHGKANILRVGPENQVSMLESN